ncbi:MAG: hypothetical protein U9P38_03990 [Campylobacterota bacterium]|nr:hypothetical protein [Campylobacterota bacterium]
MTKTYLLKHQNRNFVHKVLTGYASVRQKGFISSPEFTTNGVLAKAWRRNPLAMDTIKQ